MTFLKKATVALAASSMVAAPVAASAAPQFSDLRADSQLENSAALGGETGTAAWLLALLAAAAVIAGIIVAVDGSDDSPTSP